MQVITGAAGFIGSNLAHRLSASGCELLLVDHPLSVAKLANWVGLSRFHFMEHQDFLRELEAGRCQPEGIFHLGACSATTETSWPYLQENNVNYTRRLWLCCTQARIPFIYASSASTYGNGSLGFDDTLDPQTLLPMNLYGKSKNDFDIWALSESRAGRPTPPTWAGMKFFNVYGPREMHKGRMASVVLQAYEQIRKTGQMKLFRSTVPGLADGGQSRDFVYVHDCIDHMLWLADKPGVGGLFNSGTGQARSFYDLVSATFDALGLPRNIEFIDMPADLAKHYQNFTQATMNKWVQMDYPKRPTTLEAGVRLYVDWLQHMAGTKTSAAKAA